MAERSRRDTSFRPANLAGQGQNQRQILTHAHVARLGWPSRNVSRRVGRLRESAAGRAGLESTVGSFGRIFSAAA